MMRAYRLVINDGQMYLEPPLPNNVGDCLGDALHQHITGKPRPAGDPVVSVGTILWKGGWSKRGKRIVWGAGHCGTRDLSKFALRDIRAVRGPLSRDACIKAGWDCPDVYGDPAILLPRYFMPEVEKKYPVGYVFHFKNKREVPGWKTISPRTQDPAKFITELLECEVIVSQSLHGLILADAYGIPNVWMQMEAREDAPPLFKYHDYYASLNVERSPVKQANNIERLAQQHHIPDAMTDKLLEACPWRS